MAVRCPVCQRVAGSIPTHHMTSLQLRSQVRIHMGGSWLTFGLSPSPSLSQIHRNVLKKYSDSMYVICFPYHRWQLHKAYYAPSIVLSASGRWTKLTRIKSLFDPQRQSRYYCSHTQTCNRCWFNWPEFIAKKCHPRFEPQSSTRVVFLPTIIVRNLKMSPAKFRRNTCNISEEK